MEDTEIFRGWRKDTRISAKESRPSGLNSVSWGQVFLTAEWRNLAMLNYEVDPALLSTFVPSGTELDCWNGIAFVSLVGFQFLKTRICSVSVPYHRNFDEVNLRFYVRRIEGEEIRRGVVFIKEIVPRWAISTVARTVYHEKYIALPMIHKIETRPEQELFVEYAWRTKAGWNNVHVSATGRPLLPEQGSLQQFITEHYWGYTARRDGRATEYRVAHPSWKVWSGHDAKFEGDMSELYGEELAAVISGAPSSAFLAEGSAVTVSWGRRL